MQDKQMAIACGMQFLCRLHQSFLFCLQLCGTGQRREFMRGLLLYQHYRLSFVMFCCHSLAFRVFFHAFVLTSENKIDIVSAMSNRVLGIIKIAATASGSCSWGQEAAEYNSIGGCTKRSKHQHSVALQLSQLWHPLHELFTRQLSHMPDTAWRRQ